MEQNNQHILVTINSPAAIKKTYAIGVLDVYQASQLASRFVTIDTDPAPEIPTAHTAKRYRAF